MRELGMPFRADMAEMIRKGVKTQTRRLIEPQPKGFPARAAKWGANTWMWESNSGKTGIFDPHQFECPWQVGDRISVQEDWWHYKSDYLEQAAFVEGTICLLEDGTPAPFHENKSFDPRHYAIWKRQEPRDMPAWAARTWLEVVKDPFPQRIRDISEADCIAEGMPAVSLYSLDCDSIAPSRYMKKLCESIYPGSWERNDWVFALTFKLVEEKGGGK